MKKSENNTNKIGRKFSILFAMIAAIVAAALAVTCALCFGGASKRVPVGGDTTGSVTTSGTNRGAITGSTMITNIKNGTYALGDYMEYNYTGSVVSVQLLPGTYVLECYGAQGGAKGSNGGGKGGYAKGTYTITSTTTVYICAGNVGTNSQDSRDGSTDYSYSGGYNGGGNGSGVGGAGGGGATHIATSSFTAGSYSSYSGNLLVVAGGGGGGPTAGTTEVYNKGTNSYSTMGQGESGCHSKHNGSYLNDEGGGGGGYYGGGCVHSDDSYNGYAGQNYVKSTLTGASNSYGQRAGKGLARITIQSIANTAPTTKSHSITGKTLGALSPALSIAANTLAQDPDATTNTNGSTSTVYFNATGQQLFLESGCTTNASAYITYSMTSSAISITSFNKLPRSGTNGQANNTLTLYCKIRDNFTLSYGVSVISFTISFTAPTVTHGSNTTGVSGGTGYTYRYGTPTNTSNVNSLLDGAIYYPNNSNVWCLSIQQPVKLGETVTISAASLLSGYNSTYYSVYIVPSPAASPYTYTGTTTAIGDWTSGSSYTTYNGYASLGIKGVGAAAGVQTITATVYLVEKNSVGAVNREQPSTVYSGTGGQTLYITFRVGNNRPVLGTTSNIVSVGVGSTLNLALNTYFADTDSAISTTTHSIAEVKVPTKEFVQVNPYGSVVTTVARGGAAANTSYYNVYDSSISSAVSDASSDVATGFNPNIATSSATTTSSFLKYSYSGVTLTVTGLRSSYSQYASDRTSKKVANGGTVTAPTASGTIVNPGHFYLLIKITDNNDPTDTGIWLPIAFIVGSDVAPVNTGTAPYGQSAVTAMPSADGSVGDTFYFAPMGISVGSTSTAVGTTSLSGVTFKPLALDADNFTTSNGLSSWKSQYNEFLRITSTTAEIEASIKTSGNADVVRAELVDLTVPKTTLDGSRVSTFSGWQTSLGLTSSGNNYVFKGLKLTLLAPTRNRYCFVEVKIRDVSSATPIIVNIPVRVKNRGLSVLANSDTVTNVATLNRTNLDAESSYSNVGTPTFTYKVPVGYTFFVTPYDAIRDTDFTAEATSPEAKFGLTGGFSLNGFNGSLSGSTFTVGGAASGAAQAINALFTNAYYGSSDYAQKISQILSAHNGSSAMKKMSTSTAFSSASSATAGTLYAERLFFARGEAVNADPYGYNPTAANFAMSSVNVNGYLTVTQGTSVVINGGSPLPLDFICVRADKRTQQAAQLTLTVRDRCGNTSDCNATQTIIINIEVVNTAPVVADPSALSISVVNVVDTSDPQAPVIVRPSSRSFAISTVMHDADGDDLSFLTNKGILVANGGLIELYNLHKYTDTEITSFDDDKITDAYLKEGGNVLGDCYVRASFLSTQVIDASAVGSTKNIEKGVFVYFFVSDGRGGEMLGWKQIEVENSAPIFNADTENGFAKDETDANKYIWKIESTSSADISRSRFIVGSQFAAEHLLAGSIGSPAYNSVSADIKLIATDPDLLSGVLLSPVGTASGYVNGYQVPNFARATAFPEKNAANTDPTAIILFSEKTVDGTLSPSSTLPTGLTPTLWFLVNGTWYTRDNLVTAIASDNDIKSACFDGQGRWILRDFALQLQTSAAFDSNTKLGIRLSIRDEAQFGGDTAGLDTAYRADRTQGNEVVSGIIDPVVYLKITGTGIRSKAEFDKYGGYYVVEDPETSTNKSYVATYDNDKGSHYAKNLGGLYFDTRTEGTGESAKTIKFLSTSGVAIKSSRTTADVDGTKAGVNSGTEFTSVAQTAALDGAYKYPDSIVVPATKTGDNYDNVYVPMSYFGLLETLATPSTEYGANHGKVVYSEDYVGYDISDDSERNTFAKGNFDSFAAALSLTDGYTTWSGNLASNDPLYIANNPYVTFGAFTDTNASRSQDANSAPYYNFTYSVPTVGTDGNLIDFVDYEDNRASFVGNGRLMYLENQKAELQEHNFGLVIAKKDVRTSTRKLTLTVKLAKSKGESNNTDGKAGNTLVVTTDIIVGNSMIDLVTGSDTTDSLRLKYDGDSDTEGAGTYHVDVELSSSDSATFALVRQGKDNDELETNSQTLRSANKIYYTDADYVEDMETRDFAYFSRESLSDLSSAAQSIDVTRPYATNGNALANVLGSGSSYAGNYRAINSVLNYYGVDSVAALKTKFENSTDYTPNDGVHGSDQEGYSDYFNISTTENGRVFNLMTTRKTFINPSALEYIVKNETQFASYSWNGTAPDGYGGLTREQVTAIYASRGLVPVFTADTNSSVVSKAYYPLKVLVYDSCGAGWDSASFVALEFRVCIVNAAPTLRAGDNDRDPVKVVEADDGSKSYEYEIKLAVGQSMSVNLYSLLVDPDIYKPRSGSTYHLATRTEFSSTQDSVVRETGDYLESPYKYDAHLTPEGANANNPNNQAALMNGTAGFSQAGSKDNDVIMWMGTALGGDTSISTLKEPSNNVIWFTVNRRTTASDGTPIKNFEFKLTFYDSQGAHTQELTFKILVQNQAPTIDHDVQEKYSHVTMRVGDSFTLLTAYYDEFIGASYDENGNIICDGSNNPIESDAYKYSQTKENWDKRNNAGQFDFSKQTSAVALPNFEQHMNTVDVSHDPKFNMGYLALGKDDTPWKLRFTSYTTNQCLTITELNQMPFENENGNTMEMAGHRATALSILAGAANSRTIEISVALSDGEGTFVSHIIQIDIVSSPPKPRDGDSEEDLRVLTEAGLRPTSTAGTYSVYTIPYTPGESNSMTVEIDGEEQTAYKNFTIKPSDVAYDSDSETETNSMPFYSNGMISVGGVRLSADGLGWYNAAYFKMRIFDGALEFVVTGYNPISDYEEVTFYVGDYGNNVLDNAIMITLHVYTLYSDMLNKEVAELDAQEYSAYLAGSDVVHVKSYDSYEGIGEYENAPTETLGIGSTYAVVKFKGVTGTDGNGNSPIVDPDADEIGKSEYNISMYLLTDDVTTFAPLSATVLNSLFTRNVAAKTFGPAANAADTLKDYLIGTTSSSTVNTQKLAAFSKYADFSFGMDGTSITFIPKTATFDTKPLLYVEVEKKLGSRGTKRTGGVLVAGSVFTLDVANSALRAVDGVADENYDREVEGKKGDSFTFSIYNTAQPLDALFVDSDADDKITIDFDSESDEAYETALADALESDPDLDWESDAQAGKVRAITVAVDNTTHELEITINRRMDKVLQGGKYAENVSFPMTFTGTDRGGRTATVKIMITVGNNGATATTERIESYNPDTNVGYTFIHNGINEYTLSVQILSTSDLVIDLDDFMLDEDYAVGKDTDSYRFVRGVTSAVDYLIDEPITAHHVLNNISGESVPLVTLTPIGTADHRTGISFHAIGSYRSYTAVAYVCVMDRSTSDEYDYNGVNIRIEITVMNDRPYALGDMDTTRITLTGSNLDEPASREFFIGDYVADHNESDIVGPDSGLDAYSETYLRIYSTAYLAAERLYSTTSSGLDDKGEPIVDTDSSKLFTLYIVDSADSYGQWFVIQPAAGFYGVGSIEITVADGDMSTRSDTLTVKFRINVEVVYNPADIEDLKGITTNVGKNTIVTIDTIIPDIENTLANTSRALDTFNPSAAYTLLNVTVDASGEEFVDILHDDGSPIWTLHALKITGEPKRLTATYALKSDPEQTYSKQFLFTVNDNLRPTIIHRTIEFARYVEEENPLTTLNSDNTVYLRADQLLSDPEDDVLRIISVRSEKPSLVSVSLTDNGSLIAIKFNARGEANITIEVADETGEVCVRSFTAVNKDLPEPSLWVQVLANFESHTVMWAIILAAVLLVIIVLIIVITVAVKRKRAREELEALLVSEMEIEEQMLKLAGGPAPTSYQSFGYLPPNAGQAPIDPGMMLGAGESAPTQQNLALPTGGESSAAQGGADVPPPPDATTPYDN